MKFFKSNKCLTILFLIVTMSMNSQNNTIPSKYSRTNSNNKLYLSLGLNSSSFQDVKYSSVRYSGIGGLFNIGYSSENDKRFWETALTVNLNLEAANTHSNGSSVVVHPILFFKYLKPIKENLKVGARIDMLDFYLRKITGLGNNGNYILNGHNLYGSIQYNYQLNSNWNLIGEFDLGLLSFKNESISFAFSAPQTALDAGEFNYQDGAISNPFGYKYFKLRHIANNLNLKTAFLFQYKKRISVGYFWSMDRFSTVKNYPTTKGLHNLVFRYNILNK